MMTSCHNCYFDIYTSCLLRTDTKALDAIDCKWFRDLKEGSPLQSTASRVRNEIASEYWSQPFKKQTNRKLKFISKGEEV